MDLTLEMIKRHINNETLYNLGMEYYKIKQVKDVNIQFNRNLNCAMIVATIQESKRIKYTIVVMYNEQANKILSSRCDCIMSEKNGGICEHVAAGLIAAYYKEHPEDEKEEVVIEEVKQEEIPTSVDVELINKLASEVKGIVTIENHSTIGGLGGAIAEVLAQQPNHAPLAYVGVEDVFTESGTATEVKEKYGLSVENVIKKVEKLFR